MNPDRLLEKLLTDARHAAPSDRVPYAFESRVMHSIRTGVRADAALIWARGLWRAVVPCVMAAAVAFTASLTLLRPLDLDSNFPQLSVEQLDGSDAGAAAALDSNENSGEALW